MGKRRKIGVGEVIKEVKEEKAQKMMKFGTSRGEGTTYSNLYSTAKSPGTKYSTVSGRARALKKSCQKTS